MKTKAVEASKLFTVTVQPPVIPLRRRLNDFVRHPRGRVTCLECGFLAYSDREVVTTNRKLLRDATWPPHPNGLPMPSLDGLTCYRELWFEFEPFAEEDLLEAVIARRYCNRFLRYREKCSPPKHLEQELKSYDKWATFRVTLFGSALGSAITLLLAWLTKLLGS